MFTGEMLHISHNSCYYNLQEHHKSLPKTMISEISNRSFKKNIGVHENIFKNILICEGKSVIFEDNLLE